jgi:hypothetical protein
MPASVYAIWEIRSGAGSSNSGCFDPNVTMQTNLQSANGTSVFPTVSSPTYSFTSNDIGNYLFVRSGTNWLVGFYPIAGISGTSAILDANKITNTLPNLQPKFLDGLGLTNSLSSGTWAIDYTQKNSSGVFFTDLSIVSPTIITSASNPFTRAMNGNSIRIIGGTGFTPGIYIIADSSSFGATLDRPVGIQGSTNGSATFSGAMPDIPTASFGITQASNYSCWVNIRGETNYTMSGITTVPSMGIHCVFSGYGLTRGDNGSANFLINQNSAAASYSSGGGYLRFLNVNFNGFGNTESFGIRTSTNGLFFYNSEFRNLTGVQFGTLYNGLIKNCTFPNFSTLAFTTVSSCATTATSMFSNGYYLNCIFKNNTLNGPLISITSAGTFFVNENIFYNNNCTNVISITGASQLVTFVQNNIFAGNAGTVYRCNGYSGYAYDFYQNAYFNNSSIGNEPPNSFSSHNNIVENEIYLSENPFVDPANDNFTINNAELGGILLRNKKVIPQVSYPGASNTPNNGNLSIMQHKATPLHIGNSGGFRG